MDNKCNFCGNVCGQGSTQIKDGAIYCGACSKKAKIIMDQFKNRWNRYEANNYLQYHRFAQENYRPIFKLTGKEGHNFAVDYEHHLFYVSPLSGVGAGVKSVLQIDNKIKPINDDTLILSTYNIIGSYMRYSSSYEEAHTEVTTEWYSDQYGKIHSKTTKKDVESSEVVLKKAVIFTKEPELCIIQSLPTETNIGKSPEWGNDAGIQPLGWLMGHSDNSQPPSIMDMNNTYEENINAILNYYGILDVYKLTKLNDAFTREHIMLDDRDEYLNFSI